MTQDTGKNRSSSSDDSSAAVNQHADSERLSKLIKSDTTLDVGGGKNPAKIASPEVQRQEIFDQKSFVLGGLILPQVDSFLACMPYDALVRSLSIPSQVNSFLTWVPYDALVRSLGFLDVVSLLHCETTSKFVKDAASKAWIAVDKAIDVKRKAHGETPRERAIRSSPMYRRHLLSQYAARVEKLRPTSSETLLLDRQSILGDDYDFYIQFARVVDEERGYGAHEGVNRRKETQFLTGGVVSPSSSPDNGDELFHFDLTSLDLRCWQKLDSMLHPNGWTFTKKIIALATNERLWDVQEAALLDVTMTVVAIHRKTLKSRIVLSTDTGELFDHSYQDGVLTHDQGFMYIDEWQNDGNIPDDTTTMNCRHIFQENKWTLSIRNSY